LLPCGCDDDHTSPSRRVSGRGQDNPG
jgi:hypothetical protein